MLMVVRHRAVRLVGLLAVLVLVLAMAQRGSADAPATGSLLVATGSLAAVAGSRLLAPGPALAALHRSAAPWWLGAPGRWAGGLAVVASVAWVGATAVVAPQHGWAAAVRAGVVACWYAAAVGACSMAVAPLVGASAAGALGLATAWFGGIPPSAVAELLAPWPVLSRPAVLCWNVLPMGWRALRWEEVGGAAHGTVLLAWLVGGTLVAAWVASTAPCRDERRAGG